MKKYLDFILESKIVKPLVKVFKSREFSDYLHSTKQWKNFKPYQQGGRFKYFFPEDFSDGFLDSYTENVRFFAVMLNNKVIGLSHIRKSPYAENTWWVSYLTIDEQYRDKGYATILADELFKWVAENDIKLEASSYSKEGYLKLKPLFNKLAAKYNVKFVDTDKTLF